METQARYIAPLRNDIRIIRSLNPLWEHESFVFLTRFPCYFLFYQERDQGLRWKRFERAGQTVGQLGKLDGLEFLMERSCYFLFYQGEEQGFCWKVV
jgi:hypothetical protein